jgi:hypothetical protein
MSYPKESWEYEYNPGEVRKCKDCFLDSVVSPINESKNKNFNVKKARNSAAAENSGNKPDSGSMIKNAVPSLMVSWYRTVLVQYQVVMAGDHGGKRILSSKMEGGATRRMVRE